MAGIRAKASEDLSDPQIERVYNLLNSDSPITKKDACAMLKIAYNTTRLTKIIQNFVDKRDFCQQRKKQIRNTPISTQEAKQIISQYLSGYSLSDISEITFRSIGIIKRILGKYNIPLRNAKVNYFNPIYLPDNSITEDYSSGDLVYSSRYNQPASISSLYSTDLVGKVYCIWLYSDQQYAYQPYFELADLTSVQKLLGVEIDDSDYINEENQQKIAQAIANSKKGKKK